MFGFLGRYRAYVLVGAMLLLPLVLLYAQTRSKESRGPVVGLIVDAAGAVERVLLAATGWVSDGLQKYVTSVGNAEELMRLRRQTQSKEALQARIHELEAQNVALRKLAQAAERLDGPRPLGARIIGRSGAPLTRIARIDRGSLDGVKRGDGVVTDAGVIGRVLSTGFFTSDVLLISDPASAFDVVVQRTRARGVLRGEGTEEQYRAKVQDFDRLADVQIGDVVVTSGLESAFPPGVLVGIVEDVAPREDGLYLRATLTPSVRLSDVEWVHVLVRAPPSRPVLVGGTGPILPELTQYGFEGPPRPPPEPEPKKRVWRPKPKPTPAPVETPQPAAAEVPP